VLVVVVVVVVLVVVVLFVFVLVFLFVFFFVFFVVVVIVVVVVVCVSVRQHGTTLFRPDGNSRNLIFEYFSKIYCGNSISLKLYNTNDQFTRRRVNV